MKVIGFLVAVFFVNLAQAQEGPDLFSQKAARDRAIANQAYSERISRTQQNLLSGLQRLPSGLNHSTAKCSAGWNSNDFVHQAGNICNANGCISYFSRPSEAAGGFIFTCNFYLNNGSQCHAEAFNSPRQGYSVHCVNTKLENVPRKLIYTD